MKVEERCAKNKKKPFISEHPLNRKAPEKSYCPRLYSSSLFVQGRFKVKFGNFEHTV